MGEQASVASCTIMCNGQGPIVSVQPACLNFGETQVLQDKVMNFRLINDSPIPAQFKLTSVNTFFQNARFSKFIDIKCGKREKSNFNILYCTAQERLVMAR